jgi:Ca2+:H+ antiporter
MRGPLNFLLMGLPVAVASQLLAGPGALTLAAAALSLVPLAAWIASATAQLAAKVGSALGGFLNASLANTVELIITVLALRHGLTDLAKASITGSIICNTLFTLGLAALVGGIRHGAQKFRPKAAGRHAAMMILAVSAMALPAFAAAVQTPAERERLSVGVSLLLLATYGAYLIYSHLSAGGRGRERDVPAPSPRQTNWSRGKAIFVLAAAVLGAAIASEQLVHAVEPVSRSLGLSERFIGLILIPLLGNVAEQFSAISFARENRLNLSLSIAANSSTQIAVFVAPLLVLISRFFRPMDLVFRPIELMTLFGSTGIFAYISLDGESNWLEGAQLIALYLITALVFFFLPR